MLHIHPNSVAKIIQRFVRNNYTIYDARKRQRGLEIDPEITRQLISIELLTEWSPYSLARRTTLIEVKFKLKISRE